MSRIILGVAYRHHDLMAYIQVGGRTENAAEQAAKRLNTILREALPQTRKYPPRSKGVNEDGIFVFEVPVGIDECPNEAKAFLAEVTLDGSV